MSKRNYRVIIIDPAVVDVDRCISTAKAWRDGRCGRWRLRNDCGVSVSHTIRLLSDFVVASREYGRILARNRYTRLPREPRKKLVSVKLPIWLVEFLEEEARRRGLSRSQLIVEAIVHFLEGEGVYEKEGETLGGKTHPG